MSITIITKGIIGNINRGVEVTEVNYILPIRVNLKEVKTNIKIDKLRVFNIRVKKKIGG